MRPDLFQDRKCIHVKIDKHVHAELRSRLFRHNLSMQEVFDEFAKLFVSDDVKANRIVENLVKRKLKETIEALSEPKQRRDRSFNDLDHDALYDLIDEGQEETP